MARETDKEVSEALQAMQRQGIRQNRAGPQICGDIGMKIARDGTWYYRGSPIKRMKLVKLFATVLRKEDDGNYYLVTPVEKVVIGVDDSPFLAVEMTVSGKGRAQELHFRTNLDERVTAGLAHRLHFKSQGEGFIPYLDVRGGLAARLSRPVYYQLVELAAEEDEGPGVWSGGAFFPFPATG